MKVQPVNYNNSINSNFNNNEKSNLTFSSLNVANDKFSKHATSFGAAPNLSFVDSLKGGTAKLFDTLLANFFTSFLVVDSISMILPRTLVGLNRDRDKTGQFNYKAGAEELYREMLSGPSMNLIPMGILWMMNMKYASARMESKTLHGMTELLQTTIKNAPSKEILVNHDTLDKELAGQIFETSFSKEKYELPNREALKADFVKTLIEAKSVKPRLLLPPTKEYSQKLGAFEEIVSKIHNANKKGCTVDTHSIYLGIDNESKNKNPIIESAKDLFDDFHSYSRDITKKVAKTTAAKNTLTAYKEDLTRLTENMRSSRANIKIATAIGAFFTVGAFLLYLPKLCQQSNVSPAMASAKRAQAQAQAQAEIGGANESK